MDLNPQPYDGPVIYGLGITCGDALQAEIEFNGITFGTLAAGSTALDSIPVHADLDHGQNVAELRLGIAGQDLRGAPRAMPGEAPSSAHATLRFEGDAVEVFPDRTEITTHIFAIDSFDPSSASGASVSLPHALRIDFTPRPGSPTALWADGRPEQPAAIADEVYARTVHMAEILRARNVDAYVAQTAARRRHAARCYPQAPDAQALRAQEAEDLLALFDAPDFAVSIASQIGSRLRIQARGRLFDWIDAQDNPIISIYSNGISHPLQFQFSLLSSGLDLVR